MLERHGVGDIAEAGGAFVGGDDEVGVVASWTTVSGGWTTCAVDEVVGEIEQRPDEHPVAVDDLSSRRVGVGRLTLDDEPALRSGRHDHGVLDHLRLHQPEYLGPEILSPVAPTQPAAGDRPAAQMDTLDPGLHTQISYAGRGRAVRGSPPGRT